MRCAYGHGDVIVRCFVHSWKCPAPSVVVSYGRVYLLVDAGTTAVCDQFLPAILTTCIRWVHAGRGKLNPAGKLLSADSMSALLQEGRVIAAAMEDVGSIPLSRAIGSWWPAVAMYDAGLVKLRRTLSPLFFLQGGLLGGRGDGCCGLHCQILLIGADVAVVVCHCH